MSTAAVVLIVESPELEAPSFDVRGSWGMENIRSFGGFTRRWRTGNASPTGRLRYGRGMGGGGERRLNAKVSLTRVHSITQTRNVTPPPKKKNICSDARMLHTDIFAVQT